MSEMNTYQSININDEENEDFDVKGACATVDEKSADKVPGTSRSRGSSEFTIPCMNVSHDHADPSKQELKDARRNYEMARLRLALAKLEANDSESDAIHDQTEHHATFQRSVRSHVNLPSLDLEYFHGDPRCYLRFIQQFKVYIEDNIPEAERRLSYLVHYCKGEAKAVVQDCLMMPSELGYERARHLLKQMFGCDHVIVRATLDGIIRQRPLQIHETDRLRAFATQLRSCSIALNQVNHEGELNSSLTLEAIVRLLPMEWRKGWAERADQIFQCRAIKFEDVHQFVDEQVRICNSRYGRLAYDAQARWREPLMHPTSRPTHSRNVHHTTTLVGDNKCKLCEHIHPIWRCETFWKSGIDARWSAVRQMRLCERCLKVGHRTTQCKESNYCRVTGCQENSNRFLHEHSESIGSSVNACMTDRTIALNTVCLRIEGPKGFVDTQALVDSGSEVTIIDKSLADSVGIRGSESNVTISTINQSRCESVRKTDLSLIALKSGLKVMVPDAIIVRKLKLKPAIQHNPEEIPGLDNVELIRIEDPSVRMIIGADATEAHHVLEQKVSNNGRVLATKTVFGWAVSGSIPTDRVREIKLCHQISIEESFRKMYDNEFGDNEDPDKCPSQEDLRAVNLMDKSIRLMDGHYELPIPWKNIPPVFPDSLGMALKRLGCLKIRCRKDNGFAVRYFAEMEKNLRNGYIEPASPVEDNTSVWYIPHHAVVNEKKPDKMRVVFDCAAKAHGSALNDHLLQGPNLTNNLVKVLIRFRRYQYAVSADIREMFMQVRIKVEDRPKMRFLWWSDPNMENPKEYQLVSHPFGAKSSPFCASYALQNLVHSSQCSPEVKNIILEDFYVDDMLYSCDKREDAQRNCENTRYLLSTAGFELTKWASNDPAIITQYAGQHQGKEITNKTDELRSTLGIHWDAIADKFIFKFNVPPTRLTRRKILSAVSSIFDPIGLVAPLMMPAKLLLQRLCKMKLDWDAEIPIKEASQWNKWVEAMNGLNKLTIERGLIEDAQSNNIELHAFSDASECGYGAGIYIVVDKPMKRCKLVMSKSRVAPIKAVSIPRLELNAAALAVKLMGQVIRAELPQISKLRFWTDSKIVIHYIRNENRRFDTFVANRLSVIRAGSAVSQWRYVKSLDNPADALSRGVKSSEGIAKWMVGPVFLLRDAQEWDVEPVTVHAEETTGTISQNINTLSLEESFLDKFRGTSNYMLLLKKLAWLQRYVTYMCIMKGTDRTGALKLGPITCKELEEAEIHVARMLQRSHLCLNDGKPLQSLAALNPISMKGLLRVGGRKYPLGQTYPIILPNKSWVVELLIWQQHLLEGHSGPQHVLNRLREKYWIIQGLATTKRVLSKCLECKRQTVLPLAQQMAGLADIRTEPGWYPFEHTGVDYFGPFEVKAGRRRGKNYVCLFSCLKIRAVHLEITNSLSTDAFIMILQRFIARRGSPRVLYSDVGGNFVGAVRELKIEIQNQDQSRLNNVLLERGVQWHFNPPHASHRGGLWERMIRSVRRILWALVGNRKLTTEVLHTTIVQAEGILNNRPLCPISNDSRDLTALTPNHLLAMRTTIDSPIPDNLGDLCRKRWEQANHIATNFWKRWLREYVNILQTRQKWIKRRKNIEVDDLVLLVEDTARNNWRLGLITRADPSIDGLVRTVMVRTSRGEVLRDVRKICLLEGHTNESLDQSVT